MTGDPVRLAPEHDRSAFDSGEPTLDRWLREHAGQSDRKDGARTYVVCDDERVIGYYSLCAHAVDRDDAPPAVRIGRHNIPAILVARLAVDRTQQGRGLGARLLRDALARALHVSDQIAARIVVVHALHADAARFYARHGFRPLDEQDRLTLYVLVQDLRRSSSA